MNTPNTLRLSVYLRLFLLLLGMAGATISAQNFPVRTTVSIITPSPYLENYAEGNNLLVTVTLVDNRLSYEGLLQLNITGDGFTARTRTPVPLTLNRGVPLVLRGPQLAPFFDLNNLEIEGFAIDNTVDNGGRLPAGPITICAEFFDLNFPDQAVSNTGCGTRFVQQNNPPQLNLPFEDAEIATLAMGQPLNFSWTPRHVPQPANDEYILEVFELVPGLSWDQVIQTNLIYRSNPLMTWSFPYITNQEPALILGNRYLWRVQVRDRNPASDRQFIDFGYSAPRAFTYGTEEEIIAAACPRADRLFAQAMESRRGELAWALTGTDLLDRTELRYRAVGANWSPLVNLPTEANTFPLDSLTPGTDYEAELCVICTNGDRNCTSLAFSSLTVTEDCGPLSVPTVIPLSETSVQLTWENVEQAMGYRVYWTPVVTQIPSGPRIPGRQQQRRVPGGGLRPAPRTMPRTSGRAPLPTISVAPSLNPVADSLVISQGITQATITELVPGTDYAFRFCKLCPDGSEECYEWVLDFNGQDDDCLNNLVFTRPDSTDTTLDIAWTYDSSAVAANDSFTLIWQVADAALPPQDTVLAYADSIFTLTDYIPGYTYTLKACAACTAGQPLCKDLPPFGGCVAEYLPQLVDATSNKALLGWPVVDTPAVTTRLRYRMPFFGGWQQATVGQLTDFSAIDYPFEEEQLAQTLRLRPRLVYIAQVQTQCFDTLWSAWSEAVPFSLACTLDEVDTLSVYELTDTSALITAFSLPNAVKYTFEVRELGATTWTEFPDLSEPALPLLGLTPNTEYEVRMKYFCGQNVWSNYSPIKRFRTLPPCDRPSDLAMSNIQVSSVDLSWISSENALSTEIRYRLMPINRGYYMTAPGAWEYASFPGATGTLDNLLPGGSYEIEALSECGVNRSAYTTRDTFHLACAPPELLVSNIQINQATFSLPTISPNSGSHQFGIRVLGDSTWIDFNAITPYAFAFRTDLTDYTTYESRAKSVCPSGEVSPWSDTIQFTTPVDCRVPENLGVVSLSTSGAELRWDVTGTITEWQVRLLEQNPNQPLQLQTAPSGVGIGSIGDGDVRIGTTSGPPPPPPDPYASWQLFTVTDPGKIFAGLNPNMNYKVVVRATCPTVGWTDYSEELAFRTLCESRAPDTAYADQLLPNSALLHWSAITNCLEDYTVVIESLEPIANNTSTIALPGGITPGRTARLNAESAGFIYRDSVTTTNLSAPFSGLQPNTEYRFRVRGRTEYNNFTPEAAGYTTMADLGAAAGARIVGITDYGPYSAWYIFRTDHCAQPYDLVEEPVDRTTMEISWTPSNGVNDYEFKYKLADDAGSTWAFINTQEPFVQLTGLLSNAIYDYQVTEICQDGTTTRPAPQDSFFMERPSLNNGFYVCGALSDVNTDNMTPLPSLAVGDTIRAFDFPVIITLVSGSNGVFTGEGQIQLPYFNKAHFAFVFEGIFVNDEYQMANGYLEATGFGVEILPPWADELLGEIMGALQMLDAYNQDQQLELLDSLMACCPGSLPPDLQQLVFNVQSCYAQQDSLDNPNYSLCDDMLDDLMDSIDSLLNTIYGGTFQVQFAKDPGQAYGFDGWKPAYPDDWYEIEEMAGEDYYVPYKSTKLGAMDRVKAIVPTPAHADSVGFDMPSGAPPPLVSFSGAEAAIQFTNTRQPGDEYFLAAAQVPAEGDTLPPYIAGLLKVIPYPEIPLKVTLVPLSNAAAAGLNAADITLGLTDILGQAVVAPSVFVDDVFSPSYGAPLDAVNSGLLTNYNAEMNDIIDAYSAQETIESDRQYLFVLDASDYEPIARSGFMPRGRQFGFMYRGNISGNAAFNQALAHELGHGTYVLKHSYVEYPNAMPEGNTQNLMDRTGGTELLKWQWDLIHDPVSKPLLPGDESSELITIQIKEIFKDEVTTHGGEKYLTFLNSHGVMVHIPYDSIVNLVFATGGEAYVANEANGINFIPVGILVYFTIKVGNNKTARYTGCSSGTYFKNLVAGTSCQTHEGVYQNPNLTGTVNPLLCRHAYKQTDHYLHYVSMGVSEVPPGNQGILSFDRFVGAFYDLGTGEVKQTENIKPIDEADAYLSPQLYGSLFYRFVTNPQYSSLVDYQNIGNFYLSGFAIILDRIEDEADLCNTFRDNIDWLGLVRGDAIWGSGIVDWLNSDIDIPDGIGTAVVSSTENLLQYVYGSGYLGQSASGLSLNDIAKGILSVGFTSPKIKEYNDRIAAINMDPAVADGIIDDMFDASDYLLPCEVDGISFPDYATLELFIKRMFLDANFSTKAFGYYWTENVTTNDEEWFLLKFLRKVSPENYSNFLTFMESEIGYAGFTKHYWEELIEAIENDMFSNNGMELLKLMLKAYNKVLVDGGNSYRTDYDNLLSKINMVYHDPGDTLSFSEATIKDLKIIPYNYTGVLNRIDYWELLCSGVIMELFCGSDKPIIPPTKITDVSVTSEGLLEIYQRNKYLLFYVPFQDDLQTTLTPFEPYILDKESTFADATMLRKGFAQNQNNFAVLPAFTLYYLEENATNRTVEDIIFTAIDIATLAAPVGKLATIGRALAYIDKASSVLGIAATYAQGDSAISPEVVTTLNITSAFLGLVTLTGPAWKNLDRGKIATSIRRDYASAATLAEQGAKYEDILQHVETVGDWRNAPLNTTEANWQKLKDYIASTLRNSADDMIGATSGVTRSRINAALALLEGVDGFADFERVFQARGWNFQTYFGTNGENFVSSLSLGDRSAFRQALETWDGVGAQRVADMFADLAQNLYTQGLANRLTSLRNKVLQSNLKDAIDEVIKFSADPVAVRLKGDLEKLRLDLQRGFITDADDFIRRNRIRQQLLARIPFDIASQPGLSPGLISSIKDKLKQANIQGALTDIINATNDLDNYRLALGLQGRLDYLESRKLSGLISDETYRLEWNRIVGAALNRLDSPSVGAGDLTRLEADYMLQRIDAGELNRALEVAGELSTDPLFQQVGEQMRALRSQFDGGGMSYLEYSIARNQLAWQLINNVPLGSLPGGGLGPVLQAIKNKIASGNLIGSIEDVLSNTNSPEIYKLYAQLKGRLKRLESDYNGGGIGFEEYNLIRNRILEASIFSLPRTVTSIPAPITVNKITNALINGDIEAALTGAVSLGSNGNYAQLLGLYQDLINRQARGLVGYEEFVATRRSILRQAIDGLDISADGIGGITSSVRSTIQNTVASGDIRGAIDLALASNIDDALHAELLALKARLKNINTDQLRGVDQPDIRNAELFDGVAADLLSAIRLANSTPFETLFTAKNWDWNLFNQNFEDFLATMPPGQREDLLTGMEDWPAGTQGQDAFLRLRADVTDGSLPTGVTRADVHQVVAANPLAASKAYAALEQAGVSSDAADALLLTRYLSNNTQLLVADVANGIAGAGGFKQWMQTVIQAGNRTGTPKLSKILADFGFTNCGAAVTAAQNISNKVKNALRHLNGDPDIANFIQAYAFERGGQTFSKQVGETYAEYFDRLVDSGLFNNFIGHHMFPVELFKSEGFRKWYEAVGHQSFPLNVRGANNEWTVKNMIMLENYSTSNGLGTHASHNRYNDDLKVKIEQEWTDAMTAASNNEAIAIQIFNQRMVNFGQNLKQALLNRSVAQNGRVNTTFSDANDSIDIDSLFN